MLSRLNWNCCHRSLIQVVHLVVRFRILLVREPQGACPAVENSLQCPQFFFCDIDELFPGPVSSFIYYFLFFSLFHFPSASPSPYPSRLPSLSLSSKHCPCLCSCPCRPRYRGRQCCTTRFKFSASFAGPFPEQFPSGRVSAFCCLGRQSSDVIRYREFVPVPRGCRCSFNRGRSFFHSFL